MLNKVRGCFDLETRICRVSKTKIGKNRSKTIFIRNLFRRSSFYSIDRGKCGFEYQKASVSVQYNQTFSLEYIFLLSQPRNFRNKRNVYIIAGAFVDLVIFLWFFCSFNLRTFGRCWFVFCMFFSSVLFFSLFIFVFIRFISFRIFHLSVHSAHLI